MKFFKSRPKAAPEEAAPSRRRRRGGAAEAGRSCASRRPELRRRRTASARNAAGRWHGRDGADRPAPLQRLLLSLIAAPLAPLRRLKPKPKRVMPAWILPAVGALLVIAFLVPPSAALVAEAPSEA